MKKAGLLFCCLALYSVATCGGVLVVTSQDSLPRGAGVTFSYHPYDFFLSAQYSARKGIVEHHFRLGTGVRALCQQRIYPRASAQLSIHSLKNASLQAGAILRADVSLARVDRNSSHSTYFFEEITPGLFIGMGKRFHYRLTAGFGPAWEQTWSQQSSRYRNWFSWNHFVELSWSYAF